MVGFYKHDIAGWMDGTESLPDGEYRVYHVVCELMYLNEGPIVMHESGIAGRCNEHPLKFRINFAKLVEKKKLSFNEDGKITNARVLSELKKIIKRSSSNKATPAPPPGDPGGVVGGVARGSSGGKPPKPLKTKDPTLFPVPLEKRREDSPLANAKGAPTKNEIERKELFDRGKEVLGQQAGGMIQKLLAAKHGNIALARAAIEQASTMDNPLQYIGGIVNGGGAKGNGFAALRMQRMRQQQEDSRGG